LTIRLSVARDAIWYVTVNLPDRAPTDAAAQYYMPEPRMVQ
jgi:hypothetical protein